MDLNIIFVIKDGKSPNKDSWIKEGIANTNFKEAWQPHYSASASLDMSHLGCDVRKILQDSFVSVFDIIRDTTQGLPEFYEINWSLDAYIKSLNLFTLFDVLTLGTQKDLYGDKRSKSNLETFLETLRFMDKGHYNEMKHQVVDSVIIEFDGKHDEFTHSYPDISTEVDNEYLKEFRKVSERVTSTSMMNFIDGFMKGEKVKGVNFHIMCNNHIFKCASIRYI